LNAHGEEKEKKSFLINNKQAVNARSAKLFFFFEAIFFVHTLSDDKVTTALEFNLNKLNVPL
jgi:hypothetical protein